MQTNEILETIKMIDEEYLVFVRLQWVLVYWIVWIQTFMCHVKK